MSIFSGMIEATEKRCGRCKQLLPVSSFSPGNKTRDGLRNRCKPCNNAGNAEYRARHPETARASTANWAKNNPEKVQVKKMRWGKNNPGRMTELCRRWVERNPERAEEIQIRHRSQLHVRVHRAVRERLRAAMRRGSGRVLELVGCSHFELMEHLQRKFKPGMSWDNYGAWHIDHVIPLCAFVVEGPYDPLLKEAWALSNLQPLWAEENLRKSSKMPPNLSVLFRRP